MIRELYEIIVNYKCDEDTPVIIIDVKKSFMYHLDPVLRYGEFVVSGIRSKQGRNRVRDKHRSLFVVQTTGP